MVTMPGVLEQQLAVVRAHLGGVDAEACRAGRGCRRTARRGAPRSSGRSSRAAPPPACAMCTRWTSSAMPHAGRGVAEAADQVVVAAAAAQREAHRRVVDLVHRARVVAAARAPARGRGSPGRPPRAPRASAYSLRPDRPRSAGPPRRALQHLGPPRSSGRRTSIRWRRPPAQLAHAALQRRRGRAARGSSSSASRSSAAPRRLAAGSRYSAPSPSPMRWRASPTSSSAARSRAITSASPSAPATPISSIPACRNSRWAGRCRSSRRGRRARSSTGAAAPLRR